MIHQETVVRAELITPEMIKAVSMLIGILLFTNFGAVCGFIFSAFRKFNQMKKDVNAAHANLRGLRRAILESNDFNELKEVIQKQTTEGVR